MHQHVAGRLDARLEEWRARLATGAHPCPGRFPAGDASGKTLLSLPNAQLSPAELRPSSARPSLQDSGLQDQDSRTRDSRTPRLQDSCNSDEVLVFHAQRFSRPDPIVLLWLVLEARSHTPLMLAVVYFLVLESAMSSARFVWQRRHRPWRLHAKARR